MSTDFTPWPKISRLNRDIIITEKINGTNAAVVIVPVEGSGIDTVNEEADGENYIKFVWDREDPVDPPVVARVGEHYVFAQSRTRFITPAQDNFGFAKWVQQNAQGLFEVLGEGRHFGEWWGSGIQGSYGLTKEQGKRFSLFNVTRWAEELSAEVAHPLVPGLYRVPFYAGDKRSGTVDDMLQPNDQNIIQDALVELREYGSAASPGYRKPEGVVVFHAASNTMFKVTLEGDDAPKGPEGHRGDTEQK